MTEAEEATREGDGIVVVNPELSAGAVLQGGARRKRSNNVQYATLPDPANILGDSADPGPSRLCMRILSAFSVALALDVVIMLMYIYQKDPPIFYGDDAATGAATTYVVDATRESDNHRIQWLPLPEESAVLTKIAFGSCSSQHMPQPFWDTLADYEPSITLLMGDQVYGDCQEASCEILRQAYTDFGNIPSVQGAASNLPVMATLDDHDYGENDCHASNPYKDIARQLFADFFQLNNLPDDGVYHSGVWGPPGQRLRIILLDTRYSRSPFVKTGIHLNPYKPDNSTGTRMLSEQQWQWLQQELEDEPADLNLIVSSIQVLNDVSGEECWRHLPHERERLYNLIRDKPIVLLSGDRHVGGFYESADGRIKEVTASAWTHSVPLSVMEGCDSAETCDEPDPRRLGQFVRENNFGTIEIDWKKKQYSLALRRAESSYGVTYSPDHHDKSSDAGEILDSRGYSFA